MSRFNFSFKNTVLLSVLVLSIIYTLPNFFPEKPILQIQPANRDQKIVSLTNTPVYERIKRILSTEKIRAQFMKSDQGLILTFQDVDTQLKAHDILSPHLGENYTTAINLMPTTPRWLQYLGASPMKLGLDLRGGIHLVLAVDISSLYQEQIQTWFKEIIHHLRQLNIRYTEAQQKKEHIYLTFIDSTTLKAAVQHLKKEYPDLVFESQTTDKNAVLTIKLSKSSRLLLQQRAMEKTIQTLHNRVNELGIAEPIIQAQGDHHIVVDLPGIQDMTRAQQILGGTATLAFHLVDPLKTNPSIGGKSYTYQGHEITLNPTPVITGDAIIDASSRFNEAGQPATNITLHPAIERHLYQVSRENIGQLMAILYKETTTHTQIINDQKVPQLKKSERIISVARINSALGRHFQITGLSEMESQNLSLLLRTGTLPASIYIAEQTTIGPQLGGDNIQLGIRAIMGSFLLAVLFMMIYYQRFGWIANITLLINFSLLIAALSLLGMTLTLSGMAGILLTVALAVDAQVLIFERIREELKKGISPQGSIIAGYARAWTTILDANIATLIIAYMLFFIGSGAIKGFAVTLAIGIFTSMLSAVGFSRMLVNYFYNYRHLKHLPIGL